MFFVGLCHFEMFQSFLEIYRLLSKTAQANLNKKNKLPETDYHLGPNPNGPKKVLIGLQVGRMYGPIS
jgi:hypothetical protein